MPKPVAPASPHPALLSWHVSLGGDEFDVAGVSFADALKLFDKWNGERSSGGLTPAQLADIQARAERLAKRLESLDATT